jgi:hypothetical protein
MNTAEARRMPLGKTGRDEANDREIRALDNLDKMESLNSRERNRARLPGELPNC